MTFDPPLFAKYKVEEHEHIKEWFFDEYQYWIDDNPRGTNMWSTDFHRWPYEDRAYKKLINHFLRPYISEFVKQWNADDQWKVKWWFAQYEDGGDHRWHIHPGALFGCVYQLELPDSKQATELDGKDFGLEEGDLIIFPAQWPHRSPPNGTGRKTVIAGNIMWQDIAHPKYINRDTKYEE
tara:strand:+ start:399 stop:938 length:540 start_codon:yes stop_codon:yes gene_type:complete